MQNKILNLLEKTEMSKFGRFCYYLFFPIFFILEYINFIYFFNLIKSELFTNDEFILFLDKNEFSYKDNSFIKMDVLPNASVNKNDVSGIRNLILRDISLALVEKIKAITPINVEQYLNVSVVILPETREIPEPHYKAVVRYFRYFIVKQNWYILPIYCFVVFVLIKLSNHLLNFL